MGDFEAAVGNENSTILPPLALSNATIRTAQNGRSHFLVSLGNLEIRPGEVLALVGESGSGKTLTGLACCGISPLGTELRGQLRFGAENVLDWDENRRRRWRLAYLGYSIQQPANALYPLTTVGSYLLRLQQERLGELRHERAGEFAGDSLSADGTGAAIASLLGELGFESPSAILQRYPHELSGGEIQRVALAAALAHPRRRCYLVLDEPAENLDPPARQRVLRLLRRRKAYGSAILVITHDLALVVDIADRLAVMYGGRIVEMGPAKELRARPLHPYTKGLLEVAKAVGEKPPSSGPLPSIPPGTDMPYWEVSGCAFAPRCPFAMPICTEQEPPLVTKRGGTRVACFLYKGGKPDARA